MVFTEIPIPICICVHVSDLHIPEKHVHQAIHNLY